MEWVRALGAKDLFGSSRAEETLEEASRFLQVSLKNYLALKAETDP